MSPGPPARLLVNDVTLRDGEQAPRVALTDDEKVEIAGLLEGLGVDQIQVGFAARGPRLARRIRAAGVATPLEVICVGFAPDWRQQIDATVEAGVDVVNLLLRTSDAHLALLGLERGEVRERLAEAVACALEAGARNVTFGPSFCMQADRAFLLDLIADAHAAGATRLTVADTVGTTSPEGFAALITAIGERAPIEIGAHCHDDLGLANACTLAALRAGASWCDVSAAGIGERSGNAAIEEVVTAAVHLYGVATGVNRRALGELVPRIAAIAGVELPAAKPVVGADSFAQKLELHVRGVLSRPELFEPYPPGEVGARRVIRLGKGSGETAVQAKAAENGLAPLDAGEVEEAVTWLAREAERRKSYVEDDDFIRHLRGLRGGVGG